jgi:ribosomal protein S18 acetylase RimI-like enzyme
MKNITLKRVFLHDVRELQKISKDTFVETFSAVNSEEDMNKYLEESLSLKKLSSELEDKNSEFYFAEKNNKVIGYLKINFGSSQTELKEDKGLEIERIYVLKDFQGEKIGQLLYNNALSIAKEKHAEYVWLGVWEKNLRAINFYKKNGFVEFDKHVFQLGNDAQTDIMMKLQL